MCFFFLEQWSSTKLVVIILVVLKCFLNGRNCCYVSDKCELLEQFYYILYAIICLNPSNLKGSWLELNEASADLKTQGQSLNEQKTREMRVRTE